MKNYILLFTALAALSMWSCKKTPTPGGPSSGIELTAPDDKMAVDLMMVDEVSFSWRSQGEALSFKFYLSLSKDLSEPYTKDVDGNRVTFTAAELDNMTAGLGSEYNDLVKAYWSVRPADKLTAASPVREINITRLPPPVIAATAPAANASIDLNTSDRIEFSWTSTPVLAEYVIQFATSADFASPKSFTVTNPYNVESADFDAMLADDFGIAADAQSDIYWTVKGNESAEVAWNRKMSVRRIKGGQAAANLTAPANDTRIELKKAEKDNKITFGWDAVTGDVSIVFSSSADMKNAVSINGLSGTSADISQEQLQDLLFTYAGERGLKRFKENTVYWSIKIDGRISATTPRSLKMTGMPIFKDIRGSEVNTYDVTIIKYPNGNEVIWLAQNLNALMDVNGNELPVEYVKFPDDADKTKYAWLAEPDAGKYYSPYQADLNAKIVPKGWKMPSWDEWATLMMQAHAAYPFEIPWGSESGPGYETNTFMTAPALYDDKHPEYLAEKMVGNEDLNKWNFNLRPTGRYLYASFAPNDDDVRRRSFWYVFDNTIKPHGTLGDTNQAPSKPNAEGEWGYSICCYGPCDTWGDSGSTSGAPVRLIYIGQ